MPRKARKSLETNYFHVMVQGINRSYIFENDEEAKKYISFLYAIKKDYKLHIITHCIMGNHVHLVLKVQKVEDMSNFMKRVNLKYSIYYNKRHNRVGYVFRDRYKSQGIYSLSQLYTCIRYVYNNPIKAGLCSNPQEYPYLKYDKTMYDNICDGDDDFKLIEYETDEENIEELVKEYVDKNKLNIKENKDDMKKLVRYLKNQRNISFRKMENFIGLERKTLSRMCK